MDQEIRTNTLPSFRMLAVGCGIGTMLQYFNFVAYGTAAALIFNRVFFISSSLWFSTFVSLVTLAAGFLALPFGAILFGHFGDRISRRRMLQISISMMAATTLLVAVLPTYAAIGIAAPIILLLLRITDGVAAGGELGGAASLLFEHAPADKRGWYGALTLGGIGTSSFVGYGFFTLIFLLPQADMLAWGWRLPFIFGSTVGIIGIFIRRRLTEGEDFARLVREKRTLSVPVITLFRQHTAKILLTVGASLGYFSLSAILLIFILSYAPQKLGISATAVLVAALCGTAMQAVMTFFFGWFSDRIGKRRPVMLGGTIFSALASFPVFWLLQTRNVAVLVLTVTIGSVALGSVTGPMATFFAELFSTSLRYTGVGLATLTGSAVGLGITPLIANRIIAATGSTTGVSVYMAFVALISVGCLLALPETAQSKRDSLVVPARLPIAEL